MLAKSEESSTLTAKHTHQVYGNTFPILKNSVVMLETWAFFLEFNNCNKIKKERMKKKTTLENYWTVNYQIQHNFTLTKVITFVLIKLRTK